MSDIVVYTDGSYAQTAGGGIVVCRAGKIIVKSCRLPDCGSSSETEMSAAAEGLRIASAEGNAGDRIRLVVDFRELFLHMTDPDYVIPDRIPRYEFDTVCSATQMRGIHVSVDHVRGHGNAVEEYETRDSFMNGVAHALASLGRNGIEIVNVVPDEENIASSLEAVHPTLNPHTAVIRKNSFSRAEAAEFIGVGEDAIDDLVRHGHLPVSSETGRLYAWSVRKVARIFREMTKVNPEADTQTMNP